MTSSGEYASDKLTVVRIYSKTEKRICSQNPEEMKMHRA